MARKFAFKWMRLGLGMASWAVAVGVVLACTGGTDPKLRELEQRIEQHLAHPNAPVQGEPDPPPAEESYESWELVGV